MTREARAAAKRGDDVSAFGIVVLVIECIALLALAVIYIGGYITYRMAFYNNPKKNKVDPYTYIKDNDEPRNLFSKSLIDRILQIPYKDIYTESYDGLRLRARLYMVDENAPFAIQFHGYKSMPMIDFSGGGEMVMNMGMNVIMVDQRACGESEGRTISFGYHECRDVLTWVDYVSNNYGKDRKILLFGVSMGAATVIIAAGRGLPDNVVGVLADCPCSSTREIVTKVIYDMKLPGKLLYPLVRVGAILYGKFDPDAAEAKRIVKGAKVPILLIHGEGDDFVPCDMSRDIAAASRRVELHTFPEAPHGLSFVYDTDRYKRIAQEFCLRCLK